MLATQLPAATPDQIASTRRFERILRAMRSAALSNPRISGLYGGSLTVTDEGAMQPAQVSLGYALDSTTRGIFHVTGGIVSSLSNTILGSRSSSSAQSVSLGRITAMTQSRYVAVKLKPINTAYRFIVDGQFVSMTGTSLGVTSGSTAQWVLLDFGSRAIRRLTVEAGANGGVYGFWVEATGKCWAIDTADAVYGSFLGDSYVQGSGATRGQDNVAGVLGDLLGIHMQASPAGGTGWATSNSSYNFKERIVNGDIETYTYYPPDIVFLMGSYNDRNSSKSLITPNVLAGLQVVRGRHPATPIIAFGSAPGSLGPSVSLATSENGVAEGVAAFADPLCAFVPVSTDPNGAWITGTGTVAVATGTGNSDYLTAADGVHPVDEGYALLARRYAAGASTKLRAMYAAA